MYGIDLFDKKLFSFLLGPTFALRVESLNVPEDAEPAEVTRTKLTVHALYTIKMFRLYKQLFSLLFGIQKTSNLQK